MAYGAILGQKPQIPQPVDTVQQGNMNAVTSNAVYEAIQGITTGLNVEMGSYIGNDAKVHKINFNKEPVVFYLYKYYGTDGLKRYYYGFKGMDILIGFQTGVSGAQVERLSATWDENSISVWADDANTTYIYLALTK